MRGVSHSGAWPNFRERSTRRPRSRVRIPTRSAAGFGQGAVEKNSPDDVVGLARIAVVEPVTLSKTSRVGVTLQKKD
jgi:hypothetical protein